jgi:hypothetical protein
MSRIHVPRWRNQQLCLLHASGPTLSEKKGRRVSFECIVLEGSGVFIALHRNAHIDLARAVVLSR